MRISRLALVGLLAVWLLATLGCGVCSFTRPANRVVQATPTAVAIQITPVPQATSTRARTATPAALPTGLPTLPATPTRLPNSIIAQAQAYDQLIIDVYARVSPSVVNVSVSSQIDLSGLTTATPQAPNNRPLQMAEGSGFVYDSTGYIITNFHVVDGAVDIEVVLANGDSFPAQVVGSDKDSDLAVLKIDAPANLLPAVELGNSAGLKVGQGAIAIGNPFGLGHTVTAGIISSLGRVIPRDTGYSMAQMIQTDAAINPGNSGGPLLDMQGRVIGVNSMIVSNSGSSSGVGFAIPVDIVKRVVPALIKTGAYPHPWLGVRGGSLDSRIARALNLSELRGALIAEITPGGPAEKAGLRGGSQRVDVPGTSGTVLAGGDVILALGDCPVASFDDLITCVENTEVGQTIKVKVLRDGKIELFDLTLQQRPDQAPQ